MPLDLHHEVVDVDQLSTNGQALEGRLRENLLETMVVLNQLRECTLRGREGGGEEGEGRERGKRRTTWTLNAIPGKMDDSVPLAHLQDVGACLEIAEGLHHLLVQGLDGAFPVPSKPPHQLLDPPLVHPQPVPLPSLQQRLTVLHKGYDATKIWREHLRRKVGGGRGGSGGCQEREREVGEGGKRVGG